MPLDVYHRNMMHLGSFESCASNRAALKEATKRIARLENFTLNFSSSSFVICEYFH